MNKRVSLYFAVAFGLCLIWYFLGYQPHQAERDQLQQQIEEAQRQLADFSRTIEEVPNYLKANENLRLLRGELNSSLYAKNDILALFQQITDEATEHNLELIEINPPLSELLDLNRQTVTENEPQFLNITLNFKGRYTDFGRYLGQLETKPYFRTVNTCIIKGTQIAQPQVDLMVSFKALLGTVEAAT